MSTRAFALLLAFAFFLAGEALLNHWDRQERASAVQQYCQMTDIWKQEAAKGIAPKWRNGWPPIHGFCNANGQLPH